jgi:lipid kinase YegS
VGESFLVLNGKKADQPGIREAVNTLRDSQHHIEVRVTWEAGDIARFVTEARDREAERLIIGGGDGSVNEAVNAILRVEGRAPKVGILPLGTANDFATSCGIPAEPLKALNLALTAKPRVVDVVQANDQVFVNVASAGFGAAVTANTPVELKNFLGGGAYTVSGLIQALKFEPYRSRVRGPNWESGDKLLVGAVCNGRNAGGGQQLAPEALLNDGLLDVLLVHQFSASDVPQVLREWNDPVAEGAFVRRLRVPWLECESDHDIPVNLDGEPYASDRIRFSVRPGAVNMILPPDCPCMQH